LKEALPADEVPSGLGTRLRDRFAGLTAGEFVVPERHAPRHSTDFA
jgi:hypothetical protein